MTTVKYITPHWQAGLPLALSFILPHAVVEIPMEAMSLGIMTMSTRTIS
jgi:hypothetical protein